MFACSLCFIWQSNFVRNCSACYSRHSLYVFFSIDSYNPLTISLNHRHQTEVCSLKDFSKNPYTFAYFYHHTAIYCFSNRFICFDFSHFFYNKDFFAYCKIFSISHLDRGIIKLIAWATSFVEKRLDEMQTMPRRSLQPGPKIFTCT